MTGGKIANNSITTEKIPNSAVTSAKIANGSVEATKLRLDHDGRGNDRPSSTALGVVGADCGTDVLVGIGYIWNANSAQLYVQDIFHIPQRGRLRDRAYATARRNHLS